MSFGQPALLVALIAGPIIGLLLWLNLRWKSRAGARFGDPLMVERLTGSVHQGRRRLKPVLLAIGVVLLAVASARPLLGWDENVKTRVGSDVLIALDVSLSMAAQDVAPSRFDVAKGEIQGLLERLQGDRVGLVIFAGSALVRFPLTSDLDAARSLVQATEIDSAPRPGTALGDAVHTALTLVDPAETRDRVIVLISDGEDLGSQLTSSADEATRAAVPIFSIAVGTADGSTIPTKDGAGKATVKRDRSGQIVTSKMDAVTLRLLSTATGGRTYAATSGRSELDQLYREIARRSHTSVAGGTVRKPHEGFQLFALAAFVALSVEWVLSERRKETA